MSQLLKIFVPAGLILYAVIAAIGHHNDTVERYEYQLARAELRAEYLERVAPVIAIQDAARYEEEVRGLFKWYFSALTKLGNQFPAQREATDAYLAEIEARREAGQIKGDDFQAYKASYDQVREIWDLLESGRYSPALTAADGTMRIDFLEFEPTTIDGEKGVKGRFVLWGAQRRKIEEKSPAGTITHRYDVQATFRDVQLKLAGKDGKPVAEASFGLPAGPYVPYPESKISDFPPLAYIGSFVFPVLPANAATAEIESVVLSRSSTGRDIEARFAWKRDVPSSWKLGDGEEWRGAAVEEREELRGR